MQKGYLSISMKSLSGEEDCVRIHASTMEPGEPGMVIEVPTAHFAEAMFGRWNVPCQFGWRGKMAGGSVSAHNEPGDRRA